MRHTLITTFIFAMSSIVALSGCSAEIRPISAEPMITSVTASEQDAWGYSGYLDNVHGAIAGDSHWFNRLNICSDIMNWKSPLPTTACSFYPGGSYDEHMYTQTYAHMSYMDQIEEDMLAYSAGARHDAKTLAKYNITEETKGDYLMVEYMLGNNTYNQWNCPIVDFSTYAGDGYNDNVYYDNPEEHYTVPDISERATSGIYATSVPSDQNGFCNQASSDAHNL